jgi:hypothetical protein
MVQRPKGVGAVEKVMAHEKLKEALHYVIARCDDPNRLGAIRLNKIIWFADCFAYRKNGASITADAYVKRRLGPTPKNVLPAIAELAAEGKVAVREEALPSNYVLRQFFPLRDAEVETLSEQDREILDGYRRAICDNFSANEISNLTHDQVWEAAEIGEEIPMFATFAARSGEITEEVRQWASQAVLELAA